MQHEREEYLHPIRGSDGDHGPDWLLVQNPYHV
jgi:hypothetical protein